VAGTGEEHAAANRNKKETAKKDGQARGNVTHIGGKVHRFCERRCGTKTTEQLLHAVQPVEQPLFVFHVLPDIIQSIPK